MKSMNWNSYLLQQDRYGGFSCDHAIIFVSKFLYLSILDIAIDIASQEKERDA